MGGYPAMAPGYKKIRRAVPFLQLIIVNLPYEKHTSIQGIAVDNFIIYFGDERLILVDHI